MRDKDLIGFYINPETKEFGFRTISDNLNEFYKLLNCSLIDITSRKIGGFNVDIVCDDEGLLRDEPWVSAFVGKSPALVGSLFICCADCSTGELLDLPPLVGMAISERLVRYRSSDGRDGVAVVLDG